jgi:hypothetical protein
VVALGDPDKPALGDGEAPGAEQRVEAAGALRGELRLDRLGTVAADADQVGAMEAPVAEIGRVEPRALGPLGATISRSERDLIAAGFETGGELGGPQARLPNAVARSRRSPSPGPQTTSIRPAACRRRWRS